MQPISSSARRPAAETTTERRTFSTAEGDVMSPKNLDSSSGAEAKLLSPDEIPEAVARHLQKHDHVRCRRVAFIR